MFGFGQEVLFRLGGISIHFKFCFYFCATRILELCMMITSYALFYYFVKASKPILMKGLIMECDVYLNVFIVFVLVTLECTMYLVSMAW